MEAQDHCRLRQTLGVFLERVAGLAPPDIEEVLLRARLGAVCAQASLDMRALSANALLSQVIDGGNQELAAILLESFLGKETSFFRDREVFSFFKEELADSLRTSQGEIALWSCACASGQEPLSLSMVINEVVENLHDQHADKSYARVRLYASDISARAIAHARLARYNNFDVQHGLTVRRLLNHFEQSQDGGFWHAKDHIVKNVNLFSHNFLLSPPDCLPRPIDWIFCRYALSALTPFCALQAVLRLTSLLSPPGYLVLSPEDSGWLEEKKVMRKNTKTARLGIFKREDIILPDRDSNLR